MKKTLITTIIAVAVFGLTIAIVHADNYGIQKEFTVGTAQVIRMTDPDNGNNCYVVIPSISGSTPAISCVTQTVTTIVQQPVTPVITVKK